MSRPPGPVELRTEAVSWQEVDGAVVVLDLEGSVYLELNDTASVLWKALADHGDAATLADLLVREYGIDAEVARRDVAVFLDRLERAGLLQRQ